MREEQLLEQVEEVGIARNKAEEKVKEKENELLSKEQKDQLQRRVKNSLFLSLKRLLGPAIYSSFCLLK